MGRGCLLAKSDKCGRNIAQEVNKRLTCYNGHNMRLEKYHVFSSTFWCPTLGIICIFKALKKASISVVGVLTIFGRTYD